MGQSCDNGTHGVLRHCALISDTGTGSLVDFRFAGTLGGTDIRQHIGGLCATCHRVFDARHTAGSEQSSVKSVSATGTRFRVVPRCRNRMSAVLDPAAFLQRGGWPRKFSRPGCGLVSRQEPGFRRLLVAAEQQMSGPRISGGKFALNQVFTAFVIPRAETSGSFV